MHSSTDPDQSVELDDILLELGSTGRFQIKNYVLLSIPFIASSFYTMSYVFTALNPQYRCLVPECERFNSTEFIPPWLPIAVPYKDGYPKRCKRFQYNGPQLPSSKEYCQSQWFDPNVEESCSELFINAKHTSIANDFNLFCGNLWKMTLPGTVHNIGQFCGMPITGIFSDKFGRKITLILSIVASAVCGLLRSFSPTYIIFVILEFLDAMLGSATYISAFILATEFVRPEKRVLASTFLFCTYPIGEAILGLIAWNVLDWRNVLRIIYAPGLLALAYYWVLPESVRWLISKGRHLEAKSILEDAAVQNKLTLSTRTLTSLENNLKNEASVESKEPKYEITLSEVCKNRILLTRFVICITCWITCIFVFYGLSLNSVEIAGNLYLNFILVSLAEIPGNLAFGLFLDRVGRRYTSCGSYLLAGISCILFIFVDSTQPTFKLILFLIGKSAITMATSVIYVYTAELFPTPLRHTMVSMCSMFGRLGSMVAPQMPLLADLVWVNLPILLFGLFSILSGLLVLAFPETINIKLPDTIEEAAKIGKPQPNRN